LNLGGKQDLDALLASWPAPLPKGVAAFAEEERGWEDRADAIVSAAKAARDDEPQAAAEALFEAPPLAAEPGEEAAVTAAGEKKMSEEKESGEAPASTTTPVPTERKRTSLKEIAARASQSGARLSSPGAPPPSSKAASVRPPPSVAPASRPVEAGKDDSGVINLAVVHATATAQQVAAAEKAKPAEQPLFEDEKTVESGTSPVPKERKVAPVAVIEPKKSNAGLFGGIAIAVVGIAAAFAIMSGKPDAKPTPSAPAVAEKAPAPPSAAPATAAPAATEAPTAVASAAPEPSATAEADSKVADGSKAAPGASPSGAATAGGDHKVAKAAIPSGKPGDLQSEMAKAVGKDGAAKPAAQAAIPEPASGGGRNQNIPERPSQGAVAAAFGPVMGGAKACVAGADDVSRASVTFSGSGSVSSVSVSGWAAAHGKSGCIQAALKAARVGPFSKSSYTVGVPIRP
jgi:hypothetical protein